MTPYGMKITTAGGKAGAASAIKLVRSIYMKGIASLMIEMVEAADALRGGRRGDFLHLQIHGRVPFTAIWTVW